MFVRQLRAQHFIKAVQSKVHFWSDFYFILVIMGKSYENNQGPPGNSCSSYIHILITSHTLNSTQYI